MRRERRLSAKVFFSPAVSLRALMMREEPLKPGKPKTAGMGTIFPAREMIPGALSPGRIKNFALIQFIILIIF